VNPFGWVVVVFTALSGFFSLVSVSLQSFRRMELEEALGGPSSRRRLDRLEAQWPALRLTAGLCRAVCNVFIVVGMLYALGGTEGGWVRAAGAVAAAAALIAVFAVAVPHAWAGHGGEKILAAGLPALLACRYALWPVVQLLAVLHVPIRRLRGIPDAPAEDEDSAKREILHVAEEGRAEGSVNAEEADMIESVMEFSETDAGEIMTPRTDIFALPVDTPWDSACQQVFQAGHSRVPVYENDIDNIIGILYAKDLLAHRAQGETQAIRQTMRKCYFVPQTKTLDDLLREFKARKVHIAVVLDEYGGTAGLVTIEDVLEEIVGDIADEYDQPEAAQMQRLGEAAVEVEGRTRVDDLNDALGLEVPEDEDYDTVAGFVFSELGYIPPVGEVLAADGARFTVLAADERKITRLKVERLETPTEHEAP
jgi:putative hemolysin